MSRNSSIRHVRSAGCQDLLEHCTREQGHDLVEPVAFALIQHGFAQDRLAAKHAVLLDVVQTSVQGSTEVQRLERLERWKEGAQLLCGLGGVPEVEEAEQRPLGGADALLLVGIPGGEGLGGDVGPVVAQVQVEQAQVGHEQADVGGGEGRRRLGLGLLVVVDGGRCVCFGWLVARRRAEARCGMGSLGGWSGRGHGGGEASGMSMSMSMRPVESWSATMHLLLL